MQQQGWSDPSQAAPDWSDSMTHQPWPSTPSADAWTMQPKPPQEAQSSLPPQEEAWTLQSKPLQDDGFAVRLNPQELGRSMGGSPVVPPVPGGWSSLGGPQPSSLQSSQSSAGWRLPGPPALSSSSGSWSAPQGPPSTHMSSASTGSLSRPGSSGPGMVAPVSMSLSARSASFGSMPATGVKTGQALVHVLHSNLGRAALKMPMGVRVTVQSLTTSSKPLTSVTDGARFDPARCSMLVWNRELWFPNGNVGMPITLELMANRNFLSNGKVVARGEFTLNPSNANEIGGQLDVPLSWIGAPLPDSPSVAIIAVAVKFVASAEKPKGSTGFNRQNKFRCTLNKNWYRPGETVHALLEYSPRHYKSVPEISVEIIGRIDCSTVQSILGDPDYTTTLTRMFHQVLLYHKFVYDRDSLLRDPRNGIVANGKGGIDLQPGVYKFATSCVIPADVPSGPFELEFAHLRYEAQARLGKRKAVTAPFSVVANPYCTVPLFGPGSGSVAPMTLQTAKGASIVVQLSAAERVFYFDRVNTFSITIQAGAFPVILVDFTLMIHGELSIVENGVSAPRSWTNSVAVAQAQCPFPVQPGQFAQGTVDLSLVRPNGFARAKYLPSFRLERVHVWHQLTVNIHEPGIGTGRQDSFPVSVSFSPPSVESTVLSHGGIKAWGTRCDQIGRTFGEALK